MGTEGCVEHCFVVMMPGRGSASSFTRLLPHPPHLIHTHPHHHAQVRVLPLVVVVVVVVFSLRPPAKRARGLPEGRLFKNLPTLSAR